MHGRAAGELPRKGAGCYHQPSGTLPSHAQSTAARIPPDHRARVGNWLANRPIVVSFEVTDACTCWCKHCDHGGPRDESRNLKPADYRRYMEALRPCVVQVSGGEPLMRDDVVEIVRSIKNGCTLPYTILVSNWSHMTRGEVPRAARRRHRPVLRQPRLSRRPARRFPRLSRPLPASRRPDPAAGQARARRYRAQQLHHQRERRRHRRHRRQGARVGRQPLLQRLLGAPHRLPRLLPRLAGTTRRRSTRDSTAWRRGAMPPTGSSTRPARSKPPAGISPTAAARAAKPACASWWSPPTAQLQPCSMQFQRYPLEERDRMIARVHRHTTAATSVTSPSALTSTRASRNCCGKTSAASWR